MAAYEVLLLNTAIPQIQAAQSGDTYVVPRDIAFSTVASFAAGAEATPSIVATGDTNTGIWFPAADTVAISTGGISRLRLDSSGNLGLGVTPSAWQSTFGTRALQFTGGAVLGYRDTNFILLQNAYFDGGFKYYASSIGAAYYDMSSGAHKWFRSTSAQVINTDPVFDQAMTLDASGNLVVGGTSANVGTWNKAITLNTASGNASYELTVAGAAKGFFAADASNVYLQSSGAIPLIFTTNGGERARITSGGDFNLGVAGTNAGIFHIQTGTGVTTGRIIDAIDALGARYFEVQTDGDVYNTNGTYGTISDQKLKQDIVDAGSQWADIKAIRFRKYRMKSDVAVNPNAPALLGVVAQELEQVSPGLVDEHPDIETVEVTDEDGNVTQTQQPIGTTTKSVKTSVLLMKAAVALQEAMARIEKLEAEVAALKGA